MYKGKYNSRRRLAWTKEVILLCTIVTLLLSVAGGTLAFLTQKTQEERNVFVIPEIDVTIPEDFKDGDTVKKNVKVKNLCEFDVFARATWVAYWEHKDTKEVYSKVPNVAVDCNTNDWYVRDDGYWYCKSILAENEESPVFITTAQLAENEVAPGEDYRLVIDVIGEVVQSEPTKAAQEVWGLVPSAS